MLKGVLAEREGKLYVLYETTRDSEPMYVRMWWLVERTTGNAYNMNRPQAGDTCTSSLDAWHCSRLGVSTGSVWFPGSREAAFVESEAVQPPKVRKGIEVRWHHGAWQKFSKREGWIAA